MRVNKEIKNKGMLEIENLHKQSGTKYVSIYNTGEKTEERMSSVEYTL